MKSGHAPRKLLLMTCAALCLVCLGLGDVAYAERVKDLARVAGVRDNQLVGYGLVVGLDGTGDQTGQAPFTVQSLKSFLNRFGVRLPANVNPQLKNVAAVSVTATLPPFAKPGQTIDITVSTLGNAKSLRGGTLLLSPLKGANGQTYALGQGNVIVGGLGVETDDGSSISINVPTVGRIPNGATVERSAPTAFGERDFLVLNLHQADFTTAKRITDAVNQAIGEGTARAMDAASVRVNAPRDNGQRVSFLSLIENVALEPGEAPAKVIVNSRSGTVVIGRHVRVTAAAVAHGNLSVTISNVTEVSQPGPFAPGETVVVPKSEIEVTQENQRMFLFAPGVSLNDIVRAINQVGAAPADLVAILEALKEAGALRAELVVI
jgi:flagellar P-ring protein precursor FlgI